MRREHERNLTKKCVTMVFANTLQVGSVGLFQLTLIYIGAHNWYRHLLFSRCFPSCIWFILLFQNQFSMKSLSFYKGKVRPETVNFFFWVLQTLTKLAQPASHLHTADTTSLYAPCLSAELWQLACPANYAPSIIKGNGWSGATWGRNIFYTSAPSWECSSQYIKWSVGVFSVLHSWNNYKQTLHVCKMSPKYNSAYSK